MGLHLSDTPYDIATLTFDLAGDDTSRHYGSLYFICTPSKFVGLSIRVVLIFELLKMHVLTL